MRGGYLCAVFLSDKPFFMKSNDKTDPAASGPLLGFFVFGLMQSQQQQAERLEALRQRLCAEDGAATDAASLWSDWQRVQSDLRKSSVKTLSDVQQVV